MKTLYDIEKAYHSEYGRIPVAPIDEDGDVVEVMLLTDETSLGDFGAISWVDRSDLSDDTSDLTW